jgi:hypothetical protein
MTDAAVAAEVALEAALEAVPDEAAVTMIFL